MKKSYVIIIISLFVLENIDTKCTIVKLSARCDSFNIPEDVIQSVNYLEIRHGVREIFFPQYLFRYSNFNKLSISKCDIKRIRSDTFVDLSVSYISLLENGIERLYAGAFKNLSRLEKLSLAYNKIEVIPVEVLSGLPMQSLTLSNNLIKTIEDGALKNLPNLKRLHLDSNVLGNIVIHKILDHPETLEILWLHNNSLKILTNHMLNGLTNLKVLNLAFNQIQTIENDSFGQTPNLDTLVFTHNRIKEIDGAVFPRRGLNYLTKLYMDHNELMFLSSNFFLRLNGLKKITLVGNPWICQCLDIVTRILYDNQIREECQFEYNSGGKPVCISDESQNICSYKYNNELSSQYLQARDLVKSNTKRKYCIL